MQDRRRRNIRWEFYNIAVDRYFDICDLINDFRAGFSRSDTMDR